MMEMLCTTIFLELVAEGVVGFLKTAGKDDGEAHWRYLPEPIRNLYRALKRAREAEYPRRA